jgi:hypothetical protein
MNPAREGVMDLRSAAAAATNLKAGVDIAKALPDMKIDAAVAEKTRELASRLNPVFSATRATPPWASATFRIACISPSTSPSSARA